MKSIPVQQDNVTSLSADDFNQIPREEENLIQSAGITLDTGDLNQMGKAVAAYAGGGDFYTDAGAADAYVLTVIGSKKYPPAYFKGLRVRFKVANANTGGCTCQLGSLAALPVSTAQIPNGGSETDPVAGDLTANRMITLVYDESPDGTIPYWRLEHIDTQDVGSIATAKLVVGSAASSNAVRAELASVDAGDGGGDRAVTNTGKGVTYSRSAIGIFGTTNVRTDVIPILSVPTFTETVANARVWRAAGLSLIVPSMPAQVEIISATLVFDYEYDPALAPGETYSVTCPASISHSATPAATFDITAITVLSNIDPDHANASNHRLYITYQADW